MDHFVTEVQIIKVGELENIDIILGKRRRHLFLTGPNGCGKTALLLGMKNRLAAVGAGKLPEKNGLYMSLLSDSSEKIQSAVTPAEREDAVSRYKRNLEYVQKYTDGVELVFGDVGGVNTLGKDGKFITAYFGADRRLHAGRPKGVEEVRLGRPFGIGESPGELLLKYMVHLKTQQAYARNEGDMKCAERIQGWFLRFEGALRAILGDADLRLDYSYRDYDFRIARRGREPFGFSELSDGGSQAVAIVADLILRMDGDWLSGEGLSKYDMEGVVLIDEPEAHLDVKRQRKLMPFLIDFFPRLQFIVATHSPYVMESVPDAVVRDLGEQPAA